MKCPGFLGDSWVEGGRPLGWGLPFFYLRNLLVLIKKTYHFYACHRNELIEGRCKNLHGHTYRLTCYFRVKRLGSFNVTTLFEDFDKLMEPYIKERWDHAAIMHQDDPLTLELKGGNQYFIILPFPTSVENICHVLFGDIRDLGLDLQRLDLQETESSTIIYTYQDFSQDLDILKSLRNK